MGVEFYIMDTERRLVLDCHKNYWLPPGDASLADVIESFHEYVPAPHDRYRLWVLRCVVSWWREHAAGRRLLIATDFDEQPFEDGSREDYLRPDWMGWSMYTPVHGRWIPWSEDPWLDLRVFRTYPAVPADVQAVWFDRSDEESVALVRTPLKEVG